MARRTLRNLDARIIKLTIHYGATNGIDNISTKRIAKDLKITEPTIYVHFKTKERLLLAAYKGILANIYAGRLLRDVDEKNQSDYLQGELLRVLQLSDTHREEVIYAFNYRNSSHQKSFSSPEGDAYLNHFTKALLATIQDPDMADSVRKTLIPVCYDVFELFAYKVAKGEVRADMLTVKIMVSLIIGGLQGTRDVFYASLTPEEKKAIRQ
ncbi:MAG: TetR/AcrR family transcriptional regulator [Bacilli bacterium]|jgi:AcrR family transcriptional regulator|nr:TetR/AcrR family transcriptional regulator [Bacilli bacterium]